MTEGGQLDAREADERFRHAFETFQKLIARLEDVSERRRLEELLWELALVDDLFARADQAMYAEKAAKRCPPAHG